MLVKLFSCNAQLCQDALPEPTRATAKKKRGEPRGEAKMDQKAVEDAWLFILRTCASSGFLVIVCNRTVSYYLNQYLFEILVLNEKRWI